MFSGCPVRPVVVCPLTHLGDAILYGGISVKLATNIHNVSAGHCWKGFQGQKSKVKVMTRPVNL